MAYAFTGPGAQRPFAGDRWPEPGTWTDRARASRVEHLPVWIATELWVGTLLDPQYGRPPVLCDHDRAHARSLSDRV